MIRFDNQMGAPLKESARKKLISSLREKEPQIQEVESAYKSLYQLAGASFDDHFIFTSSGNEAVQQAIFSSYLEVTRKTGKNHFICAAHDELPVKKVMERLQEMGCVFEMIPVDERGIVTLEAICETLSPRTALISLSWANGLTGVIQPISEIAGVCKKRGVLLHLEASHVLGRGDFFFEECGADFLSFDGQVLHGPKSSGGLFIRKGLPFYPHTDSIDFPSLFALAEAAQELSRSSDYFCMEIERLKRRFEEKILERIPTTKRLFSSSPRISSITSFLFEGLSGSALHYLLKRRNLFTSFGGKGYEELPIVLRACKINAPYCFMGLSFGLSCDTTEEEIEEGTEKIIETALYLQQFSKNVWE